MVPFRDGKLRLKPRMSPGSVALKPVSDSFHAFTHGEEPSLCAEERRCREESRVSLGRVLDSPTSLSFLIALQQKIEALAPKYWPVFKSHKADGYF